MATTMNAPWQGYVTATAGLNARSGRSLYDPVVTTLSYGTPVTVHGKDGDWYAITHGGAELYVFADYVSPENPLAAIDNASFAKAIAFVLRHEGGLSLDKNDRGNWTLGIVGQGVLKGTKYGISAASYPDLDIRNLTVEHAMSIYQRNYWLASKADTLPYDMALIQLDSAVQHGTQQALRWLSETREPLPYLARRVRFYTNIETFPRYGVAWMKRIADLMAEISKDDGT